jgi:hypothetical protein
MSESDRNVLHSTDEAKGPREDSRVTSEEWTSDVDLNFKKSQRVDTIPN